MDLCVGPEFVFPLTLQSFFAQSPAPSTGYGSFPLF